MITQDYNLDLIPSQVPLVVHCSRYDVDSRTLNFLLYYGGVIFDIPYGTSASIRGTKPDHTGFEYPCTINGSTVSIDIKDQMTVVAGDVKAEIRLINNGEILGSGNFILRVEQSALDDTVPISETDIPLLETAEQNAIRAENAADRAEGLLATAVKEVNGIRPDSSGNVEIDLSNFMNFVDNPINDNILTTNNLGQAIDSGKSINSVMDKVSSPTDNHILVTDANGQAIDSGEALNINVNANFSSLDDVAIGFNGYGSLDAAISPTGAISSYQLFCFGISKSGVIRKCIIAVQYNRPHAIYINTCNDGAWTGWKTFYSDDIKSTSINLAASGLTVSNPALSIQRTGNMVTLNARCNIQANNANTVYTLTNSIPSGYRPNQLSVFSGEAVRSGSYSGVYRFVFNTDGTINFTTDKTVNQEVWLTVSYVTSDSYPA